MFTAVMLQRFLMRARKSSNVKICVEHARFCVTASSITPSKVIDLRSDTLTKPTLEMYQAMLTAPVGDDVWKEDPTVIKLQESCAALLNKKASLFVPSGTMANLIALMAHCTERGAEVILGDKSHIHIFEQAGIAQIANIGSMIVKNQENGSFDLDEVLYKIRVTDDVHQPLTKVICLENTQNFCGGLIIPNSHFKEIREIANAKHLKVHLDGARIMNACVALKVPPSHFTDHVDSVSMCFSKGLGAPIGSILVGDKDLITKAIRLRKVLGGGMRQVGVVAAAAQYAIDKNVENLAKDHANAMRLAKVLNDCGGNVLSVDLSKVHTNIVFMDMLHPERCDGTQLSERMETVTDKEFRDTGRSVSIRISKFYHDKYARFVTYLNLDDGDIKEIEAKFKYVLDELNQAL